MAVWRHASFLLSALVLQVAPQQDLCLTGQRQSPIDIESDACTSKNFRRNLCWKENYSNLVIMNTGSTAQIEYTGQKPAIKCGPLNNTYNHLQSHFHWGSTLEEGSDHSIDGKYTAAEYHAVYLNEKYKDQNEALQYFDGLAVIGILLELSAEDNQKLNGVLEGVRSVSADPGGDAKGMSSRALDFAFEHYSHTKYYTYDGSLTTAPCNEAITWIVMKEQETISAEQVEVFRGLLDINMQPILSYRRPTQPLNDRPVYCPGCGCH